MENCSQEHQQIMAELAKINKRMDEDWPLIKATHEDLIGRQYLVSVIRIIGFGTIVAAVTGLIVHFTT